uniref:Uncharacterized protein n=1 Tax=Pseudomonas aeruginosa TaxID=287 RepID=A0A7S5YCF7_PSEAI|nr:hypothetical protein [Pseudomonas aeruginosa]
MAFCQSGLAQAIYMTPEKHLSTREPDLNLTVEQFNSRRCAGWNC